MATNGTVTGTVKYRVFNVMVKYFGVPSAQRKAVGHLLPSGVFTPEGRIYEPFVHSIAPEIMRVCQIGGKSAAELIAELKKDGLLVPSIEPGNIYQAMLEESRTLHQAAVTSQTLKTLTRRQLALQELVQELGYDRAENRQVATKCIIQALGFSGVRVYNLDLKERTWEHLYTEGEEGASRFPVPSIPAEQSEKAFITKLAGGEIESGIIKRARADNLFSWVEDAHGWRSLHIPDRSSCDFVDKEQLDRDEKGDASQGRRGVGSGAAREILYLVFNGDSPQCKEVYMITNWSSGRPLFADKKQDIPLLRTFATSVARAGDLAAAYQRLEDQSIHDELTGLYNYRYFSSHLEKEHARASRNRQPLSLLIIDVDHFKKVNDNYTHPAGNYVLRTLGQLFLTKIRDKIDTVARYGGEEFAIILPETPAAAAKLIAEERFRRAVAGQEFVYEGKRIPLTISIGIDTYQVDDSSPNKKSVGDLIRNADMALMTAKQAGRNKVVVHE